MTNEEILLSALRQNILGDEAERLPALITGVVQSVGDTTCQVKLINDLVVTDVRYRATEEADKGWAVVPVVGTNCLISTIGGDLNRPYLVAMDQVSCFDLMMEDGKLRLANSEASIRGILEEIIQLIEQLTVSTGTGPSGTPLPPTLQGASDLKNTIQQLFK